MTAITQGEDTICNFDYITVVKVCKPCLPSHLRFFEKVSRLDVLLRLEQN